MHKRLVYFIVLLLAFSLLAVPASAHEHRHVGDYEITFGWRVEPAYTGLFNGPEFTISNVGEAAAEPTEEAGTHTDTEMDEHAHDASAMVEGAEETLQLEVTFGDQSKVLNLRAVWGEPGHYTADLIPMRPGDYTFHLTGMIEETEVDEIFTSADGEFSTVEPIEDIQFP